MTPGRRVDGVLKEKEDCVDRRELTENRRGGADSGTCVGRDGWDDCSMEGETTAGVDVGLVSRDKDGTGNLGSVGAKGLFGPEAGFLRD